MLGEKNREVTVGLAAALFAQPEPATGLHCPCCRGEPFPFDSGNKICCVLCSKSATLHVVDKQSMLKIEQSEHPFLISETDALDHRDWLKGMAGWFKQQQRNLAEVRAEFADDVNWVRPE